MALQMTIQAYKQSLSLENRLLQKEIYFFGKVLQVQGLFEWHEKRFPAV